jgi:citrate lyase gamma subunit
LYISNNLKKQFNDAFGSSIDEVVREAAANNEELSSTDKEILELM